jgi:hypothetical protein
MKKFISFLALLVMSFSPATVHPKAQADLDCFSGRKADEMAPVTRNNSEGTMIEVDVDQDGDLESLELDAAFSGKIRITDYDSNGYPDLVCSDTRLTIPMPNLSAMSSNTSNLSSSQLFTQVWSTSDYLESTKYHLATNLDGDSEIELVIADYNGTFPDDIATLHVLEASGDNSFTERWSFHGGPRIWTAMAAGDPDQDGEVELAVGKLGGLYGLDEWALPTVYIFASSGNDSYYLEDIINVAVDNPGMTALEALELADINQDGHLDIVVGIKDWETLFSLTKGSQIVAYTYNVATGNYEPIFSYVKVAYEYLTAMTTGDSDNDGNQEVIFIERVATTLKVIEYEGGQFIFKEPDTGIQRGVAMAVRVTDLDEDCQAEVLLGMGSGSSDSRLTVLESPANDTYQPDWRSEISAGNTILAVDVDESASPPRFVGATHSAEVLLAQYASSKNDYVVEDHFEVPSAIQLHTISIGYFDGDARCDLILTEYNGDNSSGFYSLYEQESAIKIYLPAILR